MSFYAIFRGFHILSMKRFARLWVYFLVLPGTHLCKIWISCLPLCPWIYPPEVKVRYTYVGKTRYDKVMTHKTLPCQSVFSFGHIYLTYPGNSWKSPYLLSQPIAICFSVKLCWSFVILICWLIVYSTLLKA